VPTSDVDGDEDDVNDDIWNGIFSAAFSLGADIDMLLSAAVSAFGLVGSGSVGAGTSVAW